MIKVSIIIPVYNMEEYLRDCLDSIFRQTLKEIEVICVDDSSTDRSWKLMQKYQAEHENMAVISQENAGSGEARNTGIRTAHGEYLMFVDPDDFLAADDALEALYKTAESKQVEICGGSMVKSRNGALSRVFSEKQSKSRVQTEGYLRFREYQYPFAHQRYIISRRLLLENHIFYPAYRRGQDIPFMAKALNAADRFYLITKDIYVYRIQHKQERFTEKKADDFIQALYDVVRLAIDYDLKELYDTIVSGILLFAHETWYKLLYENDTWDKTIKVNELIKEGNVKFQYDSAANCLADQKDYCRQLDEIKKEWDHTKQMIEQNKQFVIYGVGKVGTSINRFLKERGYQPFCFVVSNENENPKTWEGIPIMPLDRLSNAQDYLFILGVLDQKVKDNMRESLEQRGCSKILDFNYKSINCAEHI